MLRIFLSLSKLYSYFRYIEAKKTSKGLSSQYLAPPPLSCNRIEFEHITSSDLYINIFTNIYFTLSEGYFNEFELSTMNLNCLSTARFKFESCRLYIYKKYKYIYI